MRVIPVQAPLPGEHLVATSPVMRPEARDPRGLLRLNFWSGRSLTAEALTLEQDYRAATLAVRGRLGSAGVISGLEAGLEGPPPAETPDRRAYFVHVLPGHGLLADGEDVVVPRPLRVALSDIPVHYVRAGEDDFLPPSEAPPAGVTTGPPVDAGRFVYHIDTFAADHEPWAAVLVLCPAEFRVFDNLEPADPCELDLSRDAFADERRLDAAVLRLVQLPSALETQDDLGNPDSPQWRNLLAHAVLRMEAAVSARQHVRFAATAPLKARWSAAFRAARVLPWELLGVPLALVGVERVGAERRLFVDRAAVVRPGARSHARTRPLLGVGTPDSVETFSLPGPGTPLNWRAAIDQFAEQLLPMPLATAADVRAAAGAFRYLPPAGFLPRAALQLLTSAEASLLPTEAGRPPDRAGVNHFFPAGFSVEAVPVATEDLDAALASSAPLAGYDATATVDDVRVLIPVPQSLFDPHLLVVEQEDPVFAETEARFIAARQDWRQRRDAVRQRRDELQRAIAGPAAVAAIPETDPEQIEAEPVQTSATLGFTAARVSPASSAATSLGVTFAAQDVSAAATTLYVRVLLDQERPTGPLTSRWGDGEREVTFTWSEPPVPEPAEPEVAGLIPPVALWQRFVVTAEELGVTGRTIDRFTLETSFGRVALASVGRLLPGESPSKAVEEPWWQASQPAPAPTFTGAEWPLVTGATLLAPFEDAFVPIFPDGRSMADRIADLDRALNPPVATPRAVPMAVGTHGIDRVLGEIEQEASEADDFVDANFTRAQVNLYRIRKLILGEKDAQRLLVNPAIAVIAEQETASASAAQLSTFITAAKSKKVAPALVNEALKGVAAPRSATRADARASASRFTTASRVNPVVADKTRLEVFDRRPAADHVFVDVTTGRIVEEARVVDTGPDRAIADLGSRGGVSAGGATALDRNLLVELAKGNTHKIDLKGAQLDDIQGDRPESGPTLPPRGIAIGKRFVEPPATANLSYARAALSMLLDRMQALRLPLVDESVRPIESRPDAGEVSLLALQGRAMPADQSQALRTSAVAALTQVSEVTAEVDEAEVTMAALDLTDVKSAILRNIERAAQRQRNVANEGVATVGAMALARDAAAARLLVLEGRLAEARHDVSVSRALRQEEQQRITDVNERRDGLIRSAVRFLAYVRPRAVDATRRNLPAWKLEPFGVPAPLPACLQRHDDPPDALEKYVQLFRHAPARWFKTLQPLLARLDTPDRLIALLEAAKVSSASFLRTDVVKVLRTAAAPAVELTVLGAQRTIATLRQRTTTIQIPDKRDSRWNDFKRDAAEHASVGDVMAGRHGANDVSTAAAQELDLVQRVATCLHAEFAAIAPSIRLQWVERFSQFDRPVSLRDFTALPQFGTLDRSTRRRLQEFGDWLFGRIVSNDADAFNLVNDLVRLCLLLASHAPVNRIIAGHIPRPTPVRPGIQIPIRPVLPDLVRVGMEVHIWNGPNVVARGQVEDMIQGEVSARLDTVDKVTTTLDTSMRVQFIATSLRR